MNNRWHSRINSLMVTLPRVAMFLPPLIFFFCTIFTPPAPVEIGTNQRADSLTIQQPIEDPDGNGLVKFYEALTRTLARTKESNGMPVTRIIHYGDSHVAADILTAALRRYFQRDFGDAGPGFVLAGWPWPWYARSGVKSGASPGWHADGFGQAAVEGGGRYGLAGVSLSTDRSGEWIWMSAACSHFDLYLLKQPGGGTIDVLLDGLNYHHRVSLRSKRVGAAYLKVDAYSKGPHVIELRTVAPGQVRLFGFVAENKNAGVVYDALGINGARASRPLSWDWQILASNIERRKPDLIVISYGSNEVSDLDLDLTEYRKNFLELLNRFHKAAPEASLLVISPPDRAVRAGARWHSISAMPELVEAQRQAALSAGAVYWDLFHGMGGAGSIDRWASRSEPLAQADRVHLTQAGYQFVAEMFYYELMTDYLRTFWLDRWLFWSRFKQAEE